MTRNIHLPEEHPMQFEGDVLKSIKALENMISKNSGTRTFSIVEENCKDDDCPFTSLGRRTNIRITSQLHDVTQLGSSFITMKGDYY